MVITFMALLFILAQWMPSTHATYNKQACVDVLLVLVTVHCLVGLLLHNRVDTGRHSHMLCMLGVTHACCACWV